MVDQIREGMPLEDFLRIPHEKFEYIDGQVNIILSPVKPGHAYLSNLLAKFLRDCAEPLGLGKVMVEFPFAMVDSPDWVRGSRVPDVSFYAEHRWNAYVGDDSSWRDRPFTLIPDLVVEIVSENDNLRDVFRKADLYINDGVRLVWVIDPDPKLIYVYQPGHAEILRLGAKDTLTAVPILPEFSLQVSQLFA